MTIDVLADRYATPQMRRVWSPRTRTSLYHQIWIQVMQAQQSRGVAITQTQINGCRTVAARYLDDDDFAATYHDLVASVENRTRHDLKAHLEVFGKLVGDHISSGRAHLGLTSCDVTETATEQQIMQSLDLLRHRIVAVLGRLDERARQTADWVTAGRTHGQPAQPTLLGVRFARCAEDLIHAYVRVADLRGTMSLRGIRGAVGNHADLSAVLGLDPKDVVQAIDLSVEVNSELGSGRGLEMTAQGQTPSRAGQVDLAAALLQVAAGPGTLAATLRLMSMLGQVRERPQDGQVGSSAMPHKTNPRYLERVQGLAHVLRGYQTMITGIAGGTWFEGDVSDSVVQRIALPGVFYATDGLLRTFCHALDLLEFDRTEIQADLERSTWALMSGQLLAAAVAAGINREKAHEALRDLYARGASRPMSEALLKANAILAPIAQRARELVYDQPVNTGTAAHQIREISELVAAVVRKEPGAIGWDPDIVD